MNTLYNDVKYGLRMLARNPGFTVVVLLIIALGVGANTALFNALDQVYMRPLPVKKPRELVSVQFRFCHESWEDIEGTCSYPAYEAYHDQPGVFADLMAYTGSHSMSLRLGGETIQSRSMAVSFNYFSLLGVRPVLGRLLGSPDDVINPAAVISYGLWRRRFGGKADVVGRQIILDDKPLTIIGVAPTGFKGTIVGERPDVYLPLIACKTANAFRDPHDRWLYLLGRLKPSINRDQAQAVLQVLETRISDRKPEDIQITPVIFDGSQGYVPREAQMASYPLSLFLGIAVLVLVIACANIANLQLSRAAARQREIAVRQALGAGQWRVVRQLLVESLLLALTAGACGLLIAVPLDRIICAVLPQLVSANMPLAHRFHIVSGLHPRSLLFAMVISLGTGVAFGLAPAIQMVRRDLVPALKESTGYIDLPRRRWNPHNLLVVGQIAVAVVVTVCSGLCLRNVIDLKRTDPGFDPARIIAIRIDQEGWITDRPALRQFMEDLRERVSQLPEVRSSGLALSAPLTETGGVTQMTHIEGFDIPAGRKPNLYHGIVSPGYFQTLGQSLLAGRDFTVRDGPDAQGVMIVDETFARHYWPNQDPIGKHITLTSMMGQKTPVRTIIGVVTAVKLRSILEESRPWAYFPLAQHPRFCPVILVRTDGSPKALISMIRSEAAAIQPAPNCDVRTVAERLWQLLLPQRILTAILNSFAVVGLLLSATGIYAVMAYAVRRRTREIGIRIALGARRRDVLASVLFNGAALMMLGLALGLGMSLAGCRLLASQLPQIREWDKYFLQGIYTWDPPTYVAVTLIIAVVVLFACYFPARRAARTNPMETLRYE
ncbi:MAG: ABC transporter permease [Sedimentisphaerales bacterium]